MASLPSPLNDTDLTNNAIITYLERYADNAMHMGHDVLQIFDIKEISTAADGIARYCVKVSDGLHMMSGLLATSLNELVASSQASGIPHALSPQALLLTGTHLIAAEEILRHRLI